MMKQQFAGACVLTLLSFFVPQRPVYAQTAPVTTRVAGPFSYDVTQEVTLEGTVTRVLPHPAPGMIVGSHLVLSTSSGPVDVSLGTLALRGKDAFSAQPGQQVEATGVMKTLRDKQVLLARTVKVGDMTYVIRNLHGIPLSPQSRERTTQEDARKGETQ
jgi:hypothetical protein